MQIMHPKGLMRSEDFCYRSFRENFPISLSESVRSVPSGKYPFSTEVVVARPEGLHLRSKDASIKGLVKLSVIERRSARGLVSLAHEP